MPNDREYANLGWTENYVCAKSLIDHQLDVAQDKFVYRAVSISLAPVAMAHVYL